MANLLRLLIISIFFIAGVIIGNVYFPQRNFDQKNIVVPQKPKVSFNVDNLPQVETILKEADKYKNILIESGRDQEEIIDFENNFKRTILQLYYKEAASNYAMELLKLQTQPEHAATYMKARKHYKKFIDLMESLYPSEISQEVLVIKEKNQPLISSTITLQNTNNLTIQTKISKSELSEKTQILSTETAKTVSSN
ncbi:MAG: hypothetical protein J6S61_02655 [Elusimicrobiaceae bacterium]|nr:hypothetical protein [Elusimicrobiaceae bacterium]